MHESWLQHQSQLLSDVPFPAVNHATRISTPGRQHLLQFQQAPRYDAQSHRSRGRSRRQFLSSPVASYATKWVTMPMAVLSDSIPPSTFLLQRLVLNTHLR